MKIVAVACAGAVAAALISCGAEAPPAPSLTAQGFRISERQGGRVGTFGALKVRVEAPAGIEQLQVSERSYEVDLARSPELQHFPLFALERRAWSLRDVTLDFAPYINEKLESAGDYTFSIDVRDREGRTATQTLRVEVLADESDEADASGPPPTARRAPAASGDFRMQRVGAGPVRGAEPFGLTWTTVESVAVTIRLRVAEDEAARLAWLAPDVFGAIATRDDVARALRGEAGTASLEIATANGAAAGQVIAVLPAKSGRDGYVLRADHSETQLSDAGTTVVLVGRYKH
jgi:hypothetical protein